MRSFRILAVCALALSSAPAAMAQQASAPSTQCACKQMKSCYGTWVYMSCAQLKSLCSQANATQRMRNGCDKIEQMLGK